MTAPRPTPEPSDDELESIEMDTMDELDAELARALDAHRSAMPTKAKRRDRPTFGIQKLDSLYKSPENWEPWANVTLVHKAPPDGVDTIIGFFIEYHHKTVLGARKLIRSGADPLLGHHTEFVSDPWYVEEAVKHTAARSTQIHFTVALRIRLDDGLHSEGEHVLHVGATRGIGISRAVLDSAVRLSFVATILYLPAGLDILDGLDHACKMKLKEAFDGQA